MLDAHAELHALVTAIPVDKLRFLTADRHRAYAAILWTLLGHRRSHEIEVYYDDLMIESLRIVPTVEPGPYTPDAFRGDVKQLEDWGNLAPRRLEPRRIETLADRSLQKFLCRLDDETVAILEFLEGRSRAVVAALSDRGRHLLRDAAERLSEALRLAQKIAREPAAAEGATETPAAALADDLLRLSHLCLEVDRKVDDAARELAAFDAALVGFAVSPFRLETLAEVVDRSVGVAMGGAGSDVALETADVVLMGDDLRRLPFAVGLARRASRVVRQNLFISMGLAAVLIVCSILGLTEVSEAVVLHEGGTLLVVANGLLLLRVKPS